MKECSKTLNWIENKRYSLFLNVKGLSSISLALLESTSEILNLTIKIDKLTRDVLHQLSFFGPKLSSQAIHFFFYF